ncbi:hypothetical protein EFP19_30860 (plasmid) [Burkholderia glumae]|nr:hypothetical protein EFP19_30860 [Burkholderia glumae]
MSDIKNTNSEQRPISLLRAVFIYIICFFVLLLLFDVVHSMADVPRWAGVLGYVAIGIGLNITVLRRLVEWHPMYNTINNVSSAKLSTIAFWPISYPTLFFKLFVSKYL